MNIGVNEFSKSKPNLLSKKEENKALNKYKKEMGLEDKPVNYVEIASKHSSCENPDFPDRELPEDIFNFELILNNRKFVVLVDTLLKINKEEDLEDYPPMKLKEALEQCASYRVTCYCAYLSAYAQKKQSEEEYDLWFAEARSTARKAIKNERLLEKANKNRKDIGQITKDELEEYIISNYRTEYKEKKEMIRYWEGNEKMFLEFRDVLKDRGMHLQTLLNRVDNKTATTKLDPEVY